MGWRAGERVAFMEAKSRHVACEPPFADPWPSVTRAIVLSKVFVYVYTVLMFWVAFFRSKHSKQV